MRRRRDAEFDYYAILGLTTDATAGDIKRAYRRMAIKYHPDKNPDDKEAERMFKLCTQAYEILSDPEQRDTYDHYEHPKVKTKASTGKPDPNLDSDFIDWLRDSDFSPDDFKKADPPFTRYNKNEQRRVVKTNLWRDKDSHKE